MSITHNSDGNAKHSPIYSWASGTVTVAGAAAGTDLTGITGFTTILSQFSDAGRKPRYIKVSASATLYVKINSGDTITVGSTTPFEAFDLEVNSITVSSGGAGVTTTVHLQ